MKKAVFFIFWALTSCASRGPDSLEPLTYTEDIFSPVSFIENKSHLAMNIHYPAVEKIRKVVEEKTGFELKNRGEAHITVISPPEYEILKNKISIEEINNLSGEIQKSSFRPICVGRGRTQIDGRDEMTFYIVVESQDLKAWRNKIHEKYVVAGGGAGDFKSEIFFPHITLGFTKRDLHYEDGVFKDSQTCIYSLEPQGK